jgi:hypothetical protein
MNELIKQLAQARKEIEAMQSEADALREAALANAPGYYDILDTIQKGKDLAEHFEAQIKKEAIEQATATDNKRPHPAVQVKTFTVLEYNEQSARMWCYENFKPALKLDKKAFEALQKTKNLPDFVEVKEEQRAQIAQDLSQYLT